MASFQILRRSFQQYQWIFANYLFIYSFYFFGYSLTGLFQNLSKTVEGSVEDVIGKWRIQGRGRGGAPLIFRPNCDPKGRKIFFGDRLPLPLISRSGFGTVEKRKYKDFGKAYFCQYFDDAYYQKLTY